MYIEEKFPPFSVWTSTWSLTPFPVRMRPPEPDIPSCGRPKWMAPYAGRQADRHADRQTDIQTCIDLYG